MKIFRFTQIRASILLCVCIASLIYVGCKKIDFFEHTYDQADKSIVTQLKSWVADKKQAASYPNQVVGLDSLLIEADWSKTIVSKVSPEKSLFYVPLNNSTIGLEFFYDIQLKRIDSGNIIKTSTRLAHTNDEAMNAIKTYYETVIMKKHTSLQFSGTISSFSIFNSFQYDYTFSKGSIVSRGFVASKPNSSTTAKIKSNNTKEIKLNTEYYCEPWGHFTQWTNGMITLDYTYLVCTTCTTTSIGIKSGELFIKTNCTNSGNTGGDPGNPVPIISFWNNVSDTCLRKLLESTLTNIYGLTYDILINEYPTSAYTAFNFTQVNRGITGPLIINAETEPIINVAANGQRSVNILLNMDALSLCSQEYKAAVLMHEAIHAMIISGGDMLNNNFVHHNYMANNYVEIIAADLRAQFPNLQGDAYALAWAGMDFQSTNAWAARPQSARTQDSATLRNYWIGGSKGARPTSCN